MNINSEIQRITEMRQSIINEGILDDELFTILEQRESLTKNSKYAHEHMDSYFYDSFQIMSSVEDEFESGRPNFRMIEALLYRLKATSASVGAKRVKDSVYEMRRCLPEGDMIICKAALASVREELENLDTKLDEYFELKEQVGVANGEKQGSDKGANSKE